MVNDKIVGAQYDTPGHIGASYVDDWTPSMDQLVTGCPKTLIEPRKPHTSRPVPL